MVTMNVLDIPQGYKKTEVGVIPEDWLVEPLENFTSFISYGFTNPMPTTSSGPYMITAKDIDNGQIQYKGARTTDTLAFNKLLTPKSKPKKGDLLLTKDGTLGRLALVDDQLICINQSVAILRPNHKIVAQFFKLLLESPLYQERMFDDAGGSTIKHIYITIVNKMPLGLPANHKEQTLIATALSDVDNLISELEKLITKKQAIKTATMQQLLTGKTRLPQFALREDGTKKGYKQSELGEIPEGWDVFSLLDIANLVHGKAHEPYVVESGEYVVVNSKFVSTEGKVRKYCSQNDCAAKKGDILMVLSDLPNGKALAKCFYADQDHVYAVNQRVCIFRTNVFDSKYLQLIMNRHKYFLALDDGVTQTHILNGDIAACQLFAPVKREEQTAIATILSDMDTEIQALEQRLGKTRQIKQGMMQELLTGKTRLLQGTVNT